MDILLRIVDNITHLFGGGLHRSLTTTALKQLERRSSTSNLEVFCVLSVTLTKTRCSMMLFRQQLTHVSDNVKPDLDATMTSGNGVLPLLPSLVHRGFCTPGRNLRLHPDDYYLLGSGLGWDERWFGSTIGAGNTFKVDHEGLSFCRSPNGQMFLLADAVAEGKGDIVGQSAWTEFGGWDAYSKFFDNEWALPHHVHQGVEPAEAAGTKAKPESYYFPPQYNQRRSWAPDTLIGLRSNVTREQVRRCLEVWGTDSMDIRHLSQAYPMEIGTGFMMDTGVLHAPAGLCTYEPQRRSDTFQMFQAKTSDGWLSRNELLFKDIPEGKKGDYDYMISLLDWDKNVNADAFVTSRKLRPIADASRSFDGVDDRWVVYGDVNGYEQFSAKELTIQPGCRTTLTDAGASCILFVAGRGSIGPHQCEAPVMWRHSDILQDEFFITAKAANGTTIVNNGPYPLVSLRYFGPKTHRKEMPQFVSK